MGVAATLAPRGLGPQDPTIKLVQFVDLLGQPLSRKYVSGYTFYHNMFKFIFHYLQ